MTGIDGVILDRTTLDISGWAY